MIYIPPISNDVINYDGFYSYSCLEDHSREEIREVAILGYIDGYERKVMFLSLKQFVRYILLP